MYSATNQTTEWGKTWYKVKYFRVEVLLLYSTFWGLKHGDCRKSEYYVFTHVSSSCLSMKGNDDDDWWWQFQDWTWAWVVKRVYLIHR